LDGTLLNSHAAVSLENLDAITELTKRGVHVVPATGRTLAEIPAAVLEHPDIRYILCANGAVVFDRQSDWRHKACLSAATMQRILAVLDHYDVHVDVRHNGVCFADGDIDHEAVYDTYNVCEPHRVVIRRHAAFRTAFSAFIRSLDDVEVTVGFFRSEADRVACRAELESIDGIYVTSVAPYNLEIMSADAGKGNALYALADALGINRADTIAVGDSHNDENILRAAGLGLAVANACDSLKVIADAVICQNDDHILPYILNTYL
jgi:Cof subfamily protein (haloacid dehalogenase superfamily)